MSKVTYENPLDHLLASFSKEQMDLWKLYKEGKSIKCVTTTRLLSKDKLFKEVHDAFFQSKEW